MSSGADSVLVFGRDIRGVMKGREGGQKFQRSKVRLQKKFFLFQAKTKLDKLDETILDLMKTEQKRLKY